MAASYTTNENGEGELEPIATEEEWALIEDVLRQYEEDMEGHDHECECGHHHDEDCDCE